MIKLSLRRIILSLAGLATALSGCVDEERELVSYAPVESECSDYVIEEVKAPITKIEDKFAVLISGLTEERHTANLSVAYQVLLENGFKSENIYVLDRNGRNKYYHPVHGRGTKVFVEKAFKKLQAKIDKNDMLFVYVTNHGYKAKVEGGKIIRINKNEAGKTGKKELSLIDLVGKDIHQEEFAGLLKKMQYKLGIFLFDQCYSGGFAEEVGNDRNIAIASTDKNKSAYSRINDSIFGDFFLGFRRKGKSDTNKDGRVSLKEAFDYMMRTNTMWKNNNFKPFISSDLNPDKVFLD